MRAFAAHLHAGGIDGDAGDPGREEGVFTELVQMREGEQIGFLDDVFCLGVGSDDASCNTKQPRIEALHHFAHRVLITAAQGGHEKLVGFQ